MTPKQRVLTSVTAMVREQRDSPLSGCPDIVLLISTYIDYSVARWSLRTAAMRGSIHLLEFLAASTVRRISGLEFEAAMVAAVGNDDMAIVEWLHAFNPRVRLSVRVLDRAAEVGSLAIAQWLMAQRPPLSLGCSRHATSHAAKRGDLVMLNWLQSHFAVDYPTAALDLAASNGHLEVVQWLHAQNVKGTADAMSSAATSGHFEVVKWLHANRVEGCTVRAMDGAAERGFLEIVQWLHSNRTEGCSTAAMDGAAANGHLEVVQWLHEHRGEGCSVNAMNDAAWKGHLEVVKWLHGHRTEGCTNKAMQFAVVSGHLEVVQFLNEHRDEGDRRLAALRATASGHLEILQYLLKSCPEHTFHPEEVLALAKKSGHRHIVQWLGEL
ncbi:hypothetical protein BBJ28_00026426 [Nothophytophthora sp. Chile5]|nr:hypothetical protein BBJ28_00026426 [Nothophytophthora sp. Chile5]